MVILLLWKKIFNAFQNATDSQRTYREVFLLKELTHKNIIRLHKIIRAENEEDIYLIFEYMDSDLHYAIRSGILGEDHKRFVVYQLFKGLLFLHSANIVHRDLKPENLLIDTACQLKIADFGLARSLHETEGSAYIMTDYVATRWYRAPEIVLGSNVYTKAVDMWAVGCIISELYSSKPLFPGRSTLDQLSKIMEVTGKPNEQELEETSNSKSSLTLFNSISRLVFRSLEGVLSDCDEEALDIIKKLILFSPKNRLKIEDLVSHSYVSRFREESEEVICTSTIRVPIDDNTRKSIETYKEELHNLSDVDLIPTLQPQEQEDSGSGDKVVKDEEDNDKKKDKVKEKRPKKESVGDGDKKDKHKTKKGKSKKGKDKKHKKDKS